jgi:hypothetical protein
MYLNYCRYIRWGTSRDTPSRQGEHPAVVQLKQKWDHCLNRFVWEDLVKQMETGTLFAIDSRVACSLLLEFDPQTEQVHQSPHDQASQPTRLDWKQGPRFEIVSKPGLLSPSAYKEQPFIMVN